MTAQNDPALTYSHSSHMRRVKAAARAVGIKGAALGVLDYLCDSADFKRPFVIRAKETVAKKTGYHVDTVKAALGVLRRGGFIVAEAYATGGRHRATVYRIAAGLAERGGELPPVSAGADGEKGGAKSLEKGGQNPPKRGGNLSSPSKNLQNNLQREKGGASRAGCDNRGLDAGASPGPAAPSTVTPEKAEELRQLSADLKEAGGNYGKALEIRKAREAARAAGGGISQ